MQYGTVRTVQCLMSDKECVRDDDCVGVMYMVVMLNTRGNVHGSAVRCSVLCHIAVLCSTVLYCTVILLILCTFDKAMNSPLPRVILDPEVDLISLLFANEASSDAIIITS